MLKTAYDQVSRVITAAGFYTNGLEDCGTWQRTCVCSMRRPDGGYTGNSFWVTLLPSGWYIGTWGGKIYHLRDADRISELCISWLTHSHDETLSDFDDSLKTAFQLRPVTEDEFDRATSFES